MGDDVLLVPEIRLADMPDSGGSRAAGRGQVLREPWLRTDRVIGLLGEASGGRVLLVGEAEGLLAHRLARERGAEVTWFSPAPATGNATLSDRVTRLEGDPQDLPFETGRFDALVSQFAVDRIQQAPEALIEWGRVLRGGGAMVLVTRNALFHGVELLPAPRACASYTPGSLRSLLERCGFEVSVICTLVPDLRLPRLYRGDLSFSLRLERLPWFRYRGMLLFASGTKMTEGGAVGGQDRS